MNSDDRAAGDGAANPPANTAPSSYLCGGHVLPVWPEGQDFEARCGGVVAITRFADTGHYHRQLIEKVLAMESSGRHTRRYVQAAGAIKIYDLPSWGIPEAELLHARALEFFRRVHDQPNPVADVSWANIYHDGDFIMPHSHVRASTSIVYFLSNGDANRDDPLNGCFSVVDPRVDDCCQDQKGCMTTPWLPPMTPGVMIMFPAEIVHAVNPYRGTLPRITMAWNVNETKLPGSPIPD